MGTLVQIVYEYGGDVIKFAGDALVCIFESRENTKDEEILFQISLRALLCAWTLRGECTLDLTAHIGVGYGEICFAVLGGNESRWECLISGTCLSELSQCLDDAPSKHVALTKDCYEYLKSSLDKYNYMQSIFSIEGENLPSGNFLLRELNFSSDLNFFRSSSFTRRFLNYDGDPVNKSLIIVNSLGCSCQSLLLLQDNLRSRISQFVPQPVTQALVAGTFDFLAELREVTTVFMKWDDYDTENHKDLLSLQQHLFTAQEVIGRSGTISYNPMNRSFGILSHSYIV
jgi:hypothetical protein